MFFVTDDILDQDEGYLLRRLRSSMQTRQFVQVSLPILIVMFLLPLLIWRLRVARYNQFHLSGLHWHSSHLHSWLSFSRTPQPRYCQACTQLISGFVLFRNMGWECQICGICSHLSCVRACEKMACKTPSRPSPIEHQFREGNLMNNSVCAFCGVVCSSAFSLFGLECLWCHRTFHRPCLDQAVELGHEAATKCDLGELVSLVLPPSAVQLDDVVPVQTSKKNVSIVSRKRASSAPPSTASFKRRRGGDREVLWRMETAGPVSKRSGSEAAMGDASGDMCDRQFSEHMKGSVDDSLLLSLGRRRGRRPLTESRPPAPKKPLSILRPSRASKVSPRKLERWCLTGLEGKGSVVEAHLSTIHAAVTNAVSATYVTPPSVESLDGPSSNASPPSASVSKLDASRMNIAHMDESDVTLLESQKSAAQFAPGEASPGIEPSALESDPPNALPSGRSLETKARHLSERLQNFAKSFQRGVSAGFHPSTSVPIPKNAVVHVDPLQLSQAVVSLHELISELLFELERYGTSPILTFVNPKSGGQVGLTLLKDFYSLLNPWQVINLAEEKHPREVLRRYKALAMTSRLRILVCGGDGTVSWIVNSVYEEFKDCLSFSSLYKLHQLLRKLKSNDLTKALSELRIHRASVPIAILPLGTGNDLARVLHWGGTFESSDLSSFLKRLVFAKPLELDLWTVQVDVPMTPKFKKKDEKEADPDMAWRTVLTKSFTNYIDIGIAARIALKFHILRESHPELFRSRLGNKFLYGEVGVRDFLVDQPIDLTSTEIYCDNQRLNIKVEGGIEGLALVNIPSFAGGCNLWKSERRRLSTNIDLIDSPFHSAESSDVESEQVPEHPLGTTQQNVADQKIELVAFKSLLHLGRVQVGLADSVKLGQGSQFRFVVNSRVPFQIDGEPQVLSPCQLRIFWKATVTMLSFTAPKFRTTSQSQICRPSGSGAFRYRRTPGIGVSLDRVRRILQECVDNEELTPSQMNLLMERLPTATLG